MRPILDVRNPNLWRDVPADRIWATYRAAVDAAVTRAFGPERPRPVVAVREGPAGPARGADGRP